MIEVSNLVKNFGKTQAVRGVSFHVARGEILGLLGPNGAGKSTLMRMLTCLIPPTAGSARIAGFSITDESGEIRSRLGYLPENIGLYQDMTVRDYINFMASLKKRRDRVEETLAQTGLTGVANRLIRNLSKGYRQRVGLAQAMVGDPELLILDEPTSGLDPAQIREIRSLIVSMKGKKTVILSTHILPEVSAVCSRIAIINLGKIVARGTPEELAGGSRINAIIKGDSAVIRQTLEKVKGVHNVTVKDVKEKGAACKYIISINKESDPRSDIMTALVESGMKPLEIYRATASIEELYLKAVMGEGQ